MKDLRKYYEEFECNGMDSRYQIIHLLNSRNIMVQVYDSENGLTVHDSEYRFERTDENTAIIDFMKTPIARKRFTILLIALI